MPSSGLSSGSSGRGLQVALGLNLASAGLYVLEAMMGPTILGNVLFLGLGVLLAIVALLVGALLWFDPVERGSLKGIVVSALLVGYVVFRAVSNSAPAGYGP